MEYKIGDKVRVRKNVEEPKYKWGSVSPGDIGVVVKIDSEGDLKVDFPAQSDWDAYPPEMELAVNKKYKAGQKVLINSDGIEGLVKGAKVTVKPNQKNCDDEKYEPGTGIIIKKLDCSRKDEYDYQVRLNGNTLCFKKDALEVNSYGFKGKALGEILKKKDDDNYLVKITECPASREKEGREIKVSYDSIEEYMKKPCPLTFKQVKDILVWEKYVVADKTDAKLVDSGNSKAYTNGKKIYLPEEISEAESLPSLDGETEIYDNPNLSLYLGNMLHEVSHIRYGTFKADVSKYIEDIKNKELFRHILNILEDNRVESYFKREFKGTAYERVLDEERTFCIERVAFPKGNELLDTLMVYHLNLTELNEKKVMNEERRSELDNKIDKFLNKERKKLLDDIVDISREIKQPGKTVLDSVKIAKQVYDKLNGMFEDIKISKDFTPGRDNPIYPDDLDSGTEITPENIDSPETEKEIKKEMEKHLEKQGATQDSQKGSDGKEGKSGGDESDQGQMYDPALVEAIKEGLLERGYVSGKVDDITSKIDGFLKDRK